MFTRNNLVGFIIGGLVVLCATQGIFNYQNHKADNVSPTVITPSIKPNTSTEEVTSSIDGKITPEEAEQVQRDMESDPLATGSVMFNCVNGDKHFSITINKYLNRTSATPKNETYSIRNRGESDDGSVSYVLPMKNGGYRFLFNESTISASDMIMTPSRGRGNYTLNSGSNKITCTTNGAQDF